MIAYSIIMFVVAVPFLALGIAIYKGNTELIHDYHQKNVKESERMEYGRAFSKGLFVICATLLISGIIALFGKENPNCSSFSDRFVCGAYRFLCGSCKGSKEV